MFDLESHIATWRESFRKNQIDDDAVVEIESHLRDSFANLKRSERSEEEAWQKAVASLGDAGSIAGEFRKSSGFVWWPGLFAVGLFTLGAAGGAALMAKRGIHNRTDWLLLPHVIAITSGYTAMFATGLLAICSIIQRLFRWWDAPREAAFNKYGLIFSAIASITVAAGILLGSLWSAKNGYPFWSWDPREIGAMLVLPWALAQVEVFRRPRIAPALRLSSGLVANVITALAWFGPVILMSRRSYGTSAFESEFAGFVAINSLLAFVVWLLPQKNATSVKMVKSE